MSPLLQYIRRETVMKKFIILIPILLASACNDPLAPNKENYQKAIQNYLDRFGEKSICIHLFPEHYLNDIDNGKETFQKEHSFTITAFIENGKPYSSSLAHRRTYDWEELGLLSSSEKRIVQNRFGGDMFEITYKLKPELVKDLSLHEYRGLDNIALCSGKSKLAEFIQVSDVLTSNNGSKYVEILYNKNIYNVSDWATKQNIIDYFNIKLNSTEKTRLVLMNDGWIDSRILK